MVLCVLCALSGFVAPGGRRCLAPVRVPLLWPAACLSGVPCGPAWCAAPRPVRSLSVLRSAFSSPWCTSPPRGLAPPALPGGCAGHAEAIREPGCLCLPLAPAEAGALGSLRVVPVRATRWGRPWRVPPVLVLGCVRCGGWFVWTLSLTRPVSRTVHRSTGDSAGAPGLFCVDADTAPCGSEDATPGCRACVRVLAVLGQVGRAGLLGALWCASPFPLAALAFCFPWPLRSLCLFFFSLSAPPLSLAFSGFPAPGALGLGAVLCVFFVLRPLGSQCARLFFFLLGRWLLLGAWCPSPLLPLCLAGFVAAARCPPLFRSFVRPCCLWLSLVSGSGCPGPWRCVLFALWASRFSALSALSPFSVSRLAVGCSLVVAAPPAPLPLGAPFFFFFFALCAPVLSSFLRFSAPGAFGISAARCLLCWPPASRLSMRSRLLCASCLAVGCSPVVACPPPPLCPAVFVASAWCCGPCVVLCCVSRAAVLRCTAARCVARCCAAVCCVVLLRSVGAAASRAVPSGAPRRPGALCFAALCFAVLPRAVCVLSLRGGVCCCSPLCFVLCVSLGAVLCVPCPIRSTRCCASLCWCACVVLLVWCVLLLAPGAVVRCRVLCCFLLVCCGAVLGLVARGCLLVPYCGALLSVSLCWWCWFASFHCVCGAVLRCTSCCPVPVASALLLVPRAVACPCVLWCLPGRSAVWWCRSGVSWCLAVPCVVLWCPAPCAVSCSAVLPGGVVLVGCAVRLSALLVFVFPFVLFTFAKYPCCFSVPLKTF